MTTSSDRAVEVRTIAAAVTVETARVKGSRFLATLAPSSDEEQALRVVGEVRARHADASHHCWAFRLAGGRARTDDDGEPGSTAGPPILRHLDGAGLSDVVCVVSRWFGGTKLGTGGLVRAYGGGAAAAIDAATIIEVPRLARFELAHPWDLTAPIAAVLAAHDATTVDTAYEVEVELVVSVAVSRAAEFADAISEATSGRVTAIPA